MEKTHKETEDKESKKLVFHIASIKCEVPADPDGYAFLERKLETMKNILQ